MLEKQKRRRIDKQDDTRPDNIEQLIEKYGLEELWDYLDKIVDYSNTKVDESIVDKIYPIGSIYMSVNNTNPSDLFGGTWVAWGNGRVPVGVDANDTDFDTVEETGGEKTHTLTVAEMPAHTHTVYGRVDRYQGSGTVFREPTEENSGRNNVDTSATGSGAAHNNLQPYITCYMWKRIL